MWCLMANMLYTDVDSQCDKLVFDDGHQFITLIVQCPLKLTAPEIIEICSCSRDGWCLPKFKWFM